MKIWLAVILLNVLALDVLLFAADRTLRHVRDSACRAMEIERKRAKIETTGGPWFLTVSLYGSSFSLISLQWAPGEKFDLYGCDQNGHRYRYWRH